MKNLSSNLNWKLTLLPLNSTFEKAIKNLEKSKQKIILVVSDNEKLSGTLTDGDIRRAFLKGYQLNDKIINFVNFKPITVDINADPDIVIELMKKNLVQNLPIISETKDVLGLHSWENFHQPLKINNSLLIMAGGKGTRLSPITDNCPKPMLEVGGKPMMQHTVEKARNEGFINITISTFYRSKMIEDYFEDGKKFGVKISYLKETKPLGTAGCLSTFSKKPEIPFIVANGDILTNVSFRDLLNFHVNKNSLATMAVRPYEIQNPFGVVKTNEFEIVEFEEKPVYRSNINAGIYALSPQTLDFLKKENYCDMPTLFQSLRENNLRTMAYPIHESWLDVGQSFDLNLARDKFESNDSIK